jgi:hypothetical protein
MSHFMNTPTRWLCPLSRRPMDRFALGCQHERKCAKAIAEMVSSLQEQVYPPARVTPCGAFLGWPPVGDHSELSPGACRNAPGASLRCRRRGGMPAVESIVGRSWSTAGLSISRAAGRPRLFSSPRQSNSELSAEAWVVRGSGSHPGPIPGRMGRASHRPPR